MTQYELIAIGLATWGAALSTVLAGVRIWEARREGVRLSADYFFSNEPRMGNRININNTSKTPVLVTFWELVWVRRKWGRRIFNGGRSPDQPSDAEFTIGPHAKHVLLFTGQNHFAWDSTTASKGKIYLRLVIVGRRRPIWLKVYDPGEKWVPR